MKSALVTGARGFLGRHMVSYLDGLGYNVLATDLGQTLRGCQNTSSITYVSSDLTEPDTLDGLFGHWNNFDEIYLIASLFDYSASPGQLESVNVEGARNMYDAIWDNTDLKKSGGYRPHIVHISSAGVYSQSSEIITEESATEPEDWYGRSKLMQERVALDYCHRERDDTGLDITFVRPAPISGSDNSYGVGTALKMIAAGALNFIPGDGANIFPIVNVDDVQCALHFVANRPEAIGKTYNVACPVLYTAREMLGFAAEKLGSEIYDVRVPAGLLKMLVPPFAAAGKIIGRLPVMSMDIIGLLTNSYPLSSKKLEGIGFEFHYPDSRDALADSLARNRSEADRSLMGKFDCLFRAR